uniref:dCTP deaminase n=1 Tax=Trichocoleus desertorum TaxID=1481672 RepID=UPI0025B59AFD|nr:hypothetical protein [Trichocoleus desertorum]
MSFWSSQTLRLRLPNLITPFNADRIESASYELCLGEEAYISSLPDTPIKDRKKFFIKERETVAIPPGQFAFLITFETVTVPDNAIAFISMKFGIKAKGMVNVSGFHVDPGYSGRLIFAVYNAGPLNFHVQHGDRLFCIWFADLDDKDDSPHNKPGFDSIPTSLMNSPDAVSSLPSLVKRLDDLEKKVETYSVKQALIWTFVFFLATALLKPWLDMAQNFWLGLGNIRPELVKPNSTEKQVDEPKKGPTQLVK